MSATHHHYDPIYKRFFTNRFMIIDFIRGFLKPFVGDDFTDDDFDDDLLSLYSADHISENNQERRNDLIWRLHIKDKTFYILLLFEFQSNNDKWMAVRWLEYIALLWRKIVYSSNELELRHLPLVLPIVIYNGEQQWNAPTSLRSLLPLHEQILDKFQPNFSYLLIDIKHQLRQNMLNKDSLIAILFELENAQSLEEIIPLFEHLDKIFPVDTTHSLHNIFASWLVDNYLANTPLGEALLHCETIHEVTVMLSDRAAKWQASITAKAAAEGKAEGRAEGESLGVLHGMKQMLIAILIGQFGKLTPAIEGDVNAIDDADMLTHLALRAMHAQSLDDFRQYIPKSQA